MNFFERGFPRDSSFRFLSFLYRFSIDLSIVSLDLSDGSTLSIGNECGRYYEIEVHKSLSVLQFTKRISFDLSLLKESKAAEEDLNRLFLGTGRVGTDHKENKDLRVFLSFKHSH
jgi:hypothetical protein